MTIRTVFSIFFLFFFTYPAPSVIYSLSLHDALPIFSKFLARFQVGRTSQNCQDFSTQTALFPARHLRPRRCHTPFRSSGQRSEEHTSELQSRFDLVCRLLLEKKKKKKTKHTHTQIYV